MPMDTVDCCKMEGRATFVHIFPVSHIEKAAGKATRIGSQLLQKNAEGQHRGNALGDEGGPGRPRHAHLQRAHHVDIQGHVEHGGENEQVQGDAGPPQGVEHGGQHVVHEQEGQAQEVDVQVSGGVVQDVFRGAQQHHDLAAEREPHPAQQELMPRKESSAVETERFMRAYSRLPKVRW